MNKPFEAGFEKKAFIAGAAGRLVGAVKKLPMQGRNLATAAKQLPGKAKAAVKDFRADSARKFEIGKNRQLGQKGREAINQTFKGTSIDISKNTPKLQMVNGKKTLVKPAPKPEGVVKKTLKTGRNLAIAGTTAAGVGLYYGTKDPEAR